MIFPILFCLFFGVSSICLRFIFSGTKINLFLSDFIFAFKFRISLVFSFLESIFLMSLPLIIICLCFPPFKKLGELLLIELFPVIF